MFTPINIVESTESSGAFEQLSDCLESLRIPERYRPTPIMPTPLTSFIEFLGIRGFQAGRPQYATAWPIGMTQRMTDESLTRSISAAEEIIDTQFIDDLSDHFAACSEVNFHQPILLGVFGRIDFLPIENQPTLGTIRLDPASRIEILDGLHRLAALRRSTLPAQQIANVTVPILLSEISSTTGFTKRRAAITSPKKAKKPGRNEDRIHKAIYREIAKDSVNLSSFLTRSIDTNSTTLALRSSRLFTLNSYTRACVPLLQSLMNLPEQCAAENLADYWQYLGDLLPPWHRFGAKLTTASELRKETVLASSSMLCGLALLGGHLLEKSPSDWRIRMSPLADLDWHQDSQLWQGSIIKEGKVQKGNGVIKAAFRTLIEACESGQSIMAS